MCIPAGRLATLLLVLCSLLATPPDDAAAAKTGLPPAMQQALKILGQRGSAATEDRLKGSRAGLRSIHRKALDDEAWLDLHLLLIEIERRLTPRPRPAEATGKEFFPPSVPRTLTGPERSDPVAILDLAARVAGMEFGAKAGTPDSNQRIALAEGAARAGALVRVAGGIDVAVDPVLRAAAEVLVRVATDLAFDLDQRANARVPAGREGFAWLLSRRHRLALTPEEALELGRRAVSDCLALLQEESEKSAPGKSWQSVVAAQQEDHPQNEEQLLAYCREVTAAAEKLVRRKGLVSIPAFAARPRVILGTPSFPAPYACYLSGGKLHLGRYGGRVMVSRFEAGVGPACLSARLRDRSRPWLKVICPHEGLPGHHLQFAIASRIRRPCRRYGYSSTYVEGWGLYTEELMARAGFYTSSAERLGYLRMKLWRAVRVVVDAGLHTGDMKPSAAVRMLTDIVLLERSAAEAEVRRYMTMPTQPLSYLLGYRKIRAMRDAWVVRYGRDTEREFHDRFLALGPVPLDLAAAVLLGKRSAYDHAHP